MKNFMCVVLMLLFSASILHAADVKVSIKGVQPHAGFLRIGLFDNAEAFPEGKPFRGLEVKGDSDTITTKFPDLPPGRYALAVFQDKNGNNKLDSYLFGIPKELYGFSIVNKSGQAQFDAAAFDLPEEPGENREFPGDRFNHAP